MDIFEIATRLGAATLMGALIGLDRNLRGKAAGTRTLGLVALGSAIAALIGLDFGQSPPNVEAISRTLQGVVTGIGFLGAGVILRGKRRVHGLTTAASVWVTACLGLACGLGAWNVVIVAMVLGGALFFIGGQIEAFLDRTFAVGHGDNGGKASGKPMSQSGAPAHLTDLEDPSKHEGEKD